MKIYNTLTRTKEDFIPLAPGAVKMYVCGPTVYNYIHIGNARPLVFFDTVRRYLEYRGYAVNYVQNYTDIDDRIIEKALAEETDASVISARFIAECEKDMADLNVRPATTHPKATEEVGGMLAMIAALLEKGHAYTAPDGTVYYRSKSFSDYGKLSHKNLDDLRGGERALLVSGAEQKEDPLDFVLWKPRKEGEPFWESPWCDGRPGWHIECSVMSKKYLGEEIDIHAGGEDLIFPHHENEIAQSEGASGKPFARYWMHNAFLNIDSRKMSKSLGNFHTVREIGEKYALQALRFFLLSAHYRSPLNFSEESMEAAKNGLERIRTCVGNLQYLLDNAGETEKCEDSVCRGDRPRSPEIGADITEHAQTFTTQFITAMDDDFNTAAAIAAIFDLVKYTNSVTSEATPPATLQALKEQITALCGICGLIVEKAPEILAADIEALIAERQT
ncbi:MAG: cysteine--tRNA ligase, partial [Lachnospiraceae bacterium]|nr:cysteine--tRNA ligase [Lachnospiraceae bacterium]